MIRLFTAISLPADIRRELQQMQFGIEHGHWVPPENFHITLTYLGKVDEATAEDMHDVFSRIRMPAFDLCLQGAGFFAHGSSPNHVWAGVEKSEPLQRLKDKIDQSLHQARIPFAQDHDRYTPHVTLARMKSDAAKAEVEAEVVGFLQAHSLYRSRIFRPGEFTLYQTLQTKSGSFYEEKTGYPLG